MENVLKKTYLIGISFASAMGGLLFGYDWVVIGGAKPFYEQFFQLADQPYLQAWAMASALIGCLLGAWMSGMWSDRYGRKKLLFIAALLFLFSSIGIGAVSHFSWFIVFRLLGGVAIGVASNVSPMYIAEVSPTELRGRFVSINQLTVVLGILAAQVANWLIAEPVPTGASAADILNSWNGQMGWRWMFWAVAVPSSVFLLVTILIPESPRWLLLQGKREKAIKILNRIGGEQYAVRACEEIEQGSQSTEKSGFKALFRPEMRFVLTLGLVIAIFQQWCGINVIFNYAQEIFSAAGYEVSDILLNIVVTGITNVVFTLVGMYTVDKLGRRALMLLGAGGLTSIYLIMGACYYFHLTGITLLLLVVLAIACYAMTLAPITWVILSEIFPTKIRGAAMAVATFGLWTACFLLTYTFPLLNASLGTYGTFWLYGAICLAGFIFIKAKLPETKGKSLEEIERELVRKEIGVSNEK